MTLNPLVSIIILNYNGYADIKECFKSIYNLNYKNFEVILADNNSQDDSVKYVKENYKDVKIIEFDKNYGFAKGNNLAIAYTKGKYIALLNMDTVVDQNWISELVNVAEKSKDIGIVGGKIYQYKNNIIDFAGSFCDKYGNARHIGILKEDNKLFNKQNKAFYICGASLLLKKELYEKIKLFDPYYFAYYEDVDFCWRAWILGYSVVYVPSSFIYHKVGGVLKDKNKKLYFLERNRLRTILKNYEIKSIFRIFPNYIYIRLEKIFRVRVLKNRFSSQLFIIYLKAFLWNILHIRSLIQNRIFIQSRRKKDDKFLFSLMKELREFANKINLHWKK